ncbi:MAG: radical SAM protein [Methanobacteriota archaeon]|nr:MAG: radical SAM protein [Euryarchaeota archaeon]
MTVLDVRLIKCRSAASASRLPGLDMAVNPYRGCGHSCAYCYAQDVTRFETGRPWGSVVEVKVNIVPRLRKELERGLKGVYGVGTVTDPYQPLEAEHQLTRGCLSMLKRFDAEASVLTKSDLVLRDVDVLRSWDSVEVGVSVGCADDHIASIIEPGAPPPKARFEALSALADAGVEVYLMAAPIIPGLSDSSSQLRTLAELAADAHVERIIWDRWNVKPIASSRLGAALEGASMSGEWRKGANAASRIRAELAGLCKSKGIDLVDAF